VILQAVAAIAGRGGPHTGDCPCPKFRSPILLVAAFMNFSNSVVYCIDPAPRSNHESRSGLTAPMEVSVVECGANGLSGGSKTPVGVLRDWTV
jgi:hypothetical protein